MTYTLHDVTMAKRKSSARMIVQLIWAMHNVTNITNEELGNVLDYMLEHQDMFNKGYFNYKDIIRSLQEERELDLRALLKVL